MDIGQAFNGLISEIVSVLPTSPLRPFLNQFASLPGLNWLNWFFPVSECLAVLAAWLVAYGLYLIYSVVMRWVKMIGD